MVRHDDTHIPIIIGAEYTIKIFLDEVYLKIALDKDLVKKEIKEIRDEMKEDRKRGRNEWNYICEEICDEINSDQLGKKRMSL